MEIGAGVKNAARADVRVCHKDQDCVDGDFIFNFWENDVVFRWCKGKVVDVETGGFKETVGSCRMVSILSASHS